MTVMGMVWPVQMISPVLRCHHMSGSSKRDRTVNTASTTRRPASITGKEKTLCRNRMINGFSVLAAAMDAVVTLFPPGGYLGRREGLVRRAGRVREAG